MKNQDTTKLLELLMLSSQDNSTDKNKQKMHSYTHKTQKQSFHSWNQIQLLTFVLLRFPDQVDNGQELIVNQKLSPSSLKTLLISKNNQNTKKKTLKLKRFRECKRKNLKMVSQVGKERKERRVNLERQWYSDNLFI